MFRLLIDECITCIKETDLNHFRSRIPERPSYRIGNYGFEMYLETTKHPLFFERVQSQVTALSNEHVTAYLPELFVRLNHNNYVYEFENAIVPMIDHMSVIVQAYDRYKTFEKEKKDELRRQLIMINEVASLEYKGDTLLQYNFNRLKIICEKILRVNDEEYNRDILVFEIMIYYKMIMTYMENIKKSTRIDEAMFHIFVPMQCVQIIKDLTQFRIMEEFVNLKHESEYKVVEREEEMWFHKVGLCDWKCSIEDENENEEWKYLCNLK